MKRSLGLLALTPLLLASTCFRDTEQVTFYPTYGYLESGEWRIPLRIWVHEPRERVGEKLAAAVVHAGEAVDVSDPQASDNARDRIADLVADDESGQAVTLGFDDDPQEETWSYPQSDANGWVHEASLTLPAARAEELLGSQGSEDGWLTYRAVSPGHEGEGRVRLIGERGISVVSDIDDTVKVTEIPADWKVVARRTFFQDFEAAPGMLERYRELAEQGAVFHYVSGGPWQLHRPLFEFLQEETGFPEGSYHMKLVPKNLRSPDTLDELTRTLTGGTRATFDQKVAQIGEIFRHFPERRFVLVGDSGECDPEVYRTIAADPALGGRVQAIWIRNVVQGQEERLERMRELSAVEVEVIETAGALDAPTRCELAE